MPTFDQTQHQEMNRLAVENENLKLEVAEYKARITHLENDNALLELRITTLETALEVWTEAEADNEPTPTRKAKSTDVPRMRLGEELQIPYPDNTPPDEPV